MTARRWITDWAPEDERYWLRTGRRIAHRNLAFSILAEHLGFSVWLMWSAVAVMLPAAGFRFDADQLFWIVALPNLVGAFLRIPYTAAVARFGGRNWTIVSAALLLIPLALLAQCVTNPSTPYWMFLVSAATAGVGGGVFASAMANISHFYPERHKGFALGVTAAGGNLGVAVVQVVVPPVVGLAILGAAQRSGTHLQNVALLYLGPVLLATLCAWLFMDNLSAVRSSLATQLSALRFRHTWVISFLYIGTFGSFIGYSAAFPLLIKTQFANTGAYLAFLGPLVGSLSRPVGGWLSDRIGGARVTAAVFLAMAAGVCAVLLAVGARSFPLFLLSFLFLFVISGIGNGSTYRMIPAIFRTEALRSTTAHPATLALIRTPATSDPSSPAALSRATTAIGVDPDDPERAPGPGRDRTATDHDDRERALALGRTRAAAVIGLASAIGAIGGFLIPRGFGISIAHTGSIAPALLIFLAGYAVCLAATWWYYLRPEFTTAI